MPGAAHHALNAGQGASTIGVDLLCRSVSLQHWKGIGAIPLGAWALTRRARTPFVAASASALGDDPVVQLGGQRMDLASQLGVRLQLQLRLDEVMVHLRLLKAGLTVLADHHESMCTPCAGQPPLTPA